MIKICRRPRHPRKLKDGYSLAALEPPTIVAASHLSSQRIIGCISERLLPICTIRIDDSAVLNLEDITGSATMNSTSARAESGRDIKDMASTVDAARSNQP